MRSSSAPPAATAGVRDWLAALDPKTGETKWKTYSIPAPGEPGSETWKDKNNAWQTGGGALLRHRLLRSRTPTSPIGDPAIRSRPTNSPTVRATISTPTARIAFDAATGKITWYFQYTPNDNHDYDETGTHILIDTKVNGEDRKIIAHAGRNGFNYTLRSPQRPVPQGDPDTSKI